MKLEPPEFLKNLYRDMRDRRLLLPAVLLIVGLVAVPVLLAKHADTSSVAASKAGSEGESAAVPAVVTQELGVTNYRKRLDRLQSKNPFRQPFAAAPELSNRVKKASITSSNIPSTDTGTADAATSSDSASAAGVTDTGTVSTDTSSAASTTASPPPTSSVGNANTRHPKPKRLYYAWRASVKVGESGHLKDRPEVQRLALLPSEGKPVVTFLGATEDGSQALFLVSSDVDDVGGDGRCLPSHSSCRYVVMSKGDKTSFHYAPNNTRYNLVLVDIHAVEVTDKLPKKPAGKAQPQQKLPLLGDG